MDTTVMNPIAAVDEIRNTNSQTYIHVGYSANLIQISGFEKSLTNAAENNAQLNRVDKPSQTEKAVIMPLDYINDEASNIINYAKSAVQSGNELTPSEIVILTARSHEFMFHCQLTSNIANRTSDGLQQLFRQQS
jgi:hypothetical protein